MKGKKFNKKIVMISAVFIVMIGVIITICVLWMRSPGIHFLLGFMRADSKEKCYIYDSEKDEFLGQTEVTIKGRSNGITKKFRGEVSVDGYELDAAPVDESEADTENSIWETVYHGAGKMKKDENGEDYWGAAVSSYLYHVRINTKNSDEYCIAVSGVDEGIFIIHAASEKEARVLFKKIYKQ